MTYIIIKPIRNKYFCYQEPEMDSENPLMLLCKKRDQHNSLFSGKNVGRSILRKAIKAYKSQIKRAFHNFIICNEEVGK